MKALKILIPILLIALVGAGLYFYFTSDFQLSAEFHIKLAEYEYSRGRAEKAAEHYEQALSKSAADTELVLTLASVYTELGNYTKTEYALVRGIAFTPSDTRLYIALSRAYVAQDKLMDAVSMLENISDPTAAAAIEAARPAPPTISPEGGEYSEYLHISLSYPAGCNAYFSTDYSYPSTAGGAYSEILEVFGSTEVSAISVSAEGLVSNPVTVEYSISHVVEDVSFTDPEVERVVRDILQADYGTSLTTEDLWVIKTLPIPETALTLEDLRWFSELPGISFTSIAGFDLTKLQELGNLKELTLSGCELTSNAMQIIGTLTGLTYLDISDTTISSLEPLKALTGLRHLLASNNSIVDLKPLSGLTGIEVLDVSYNAIEDIKPLTGMANMRSVNVSYNLISGIAPLSDMDGLYYVNISHNSVSDISALSNKPALEDCDCSFNSISSIESLKQSTAMRTLDVSKNNLTKIDVVSNMKSLRSLSANENEIESVPSFDKHESLVWIYLNHNKLTSIDSFVGAPALNYLDLDYNDIEDISELISCRMLVQVNVFGNNVGDVKELTDAGILVHKG